VTPFQRSSLLHISNMTLRGFLSSSLPAGFLLRLMHALRSTCCSGLIFQHHNMLLRQVAGVDRPLSCQGQHLRRLTLQQKQGNHRSQIAAKFERGHLQQGRRMHAAYAGGVTGRRICRTRKGRTWTGRVCFESNDIV